VLNSASKRTSIRRKIVKQLTTLVVTVLLVSILVVIFLVREQVEDHAQQLLNFKAKVLQDKIEKRLQYLLENTTQLTKHKLMVNALTDSEGRKQYLPPLIENFMQGKDVISLDLVDFDGLPIYQTQHKLPGYNDSSFLRTALAYSKLSYFLDDNNLLVVVSPVEYYSTTQGAVIVIFDLESIIKRNLLQDPGSYIRLLRDRDTILSLKFNPDNNYYSYIHTNISQDSLLAQLGLDLEVGIPSKIYEAPVIDIIIQLALVGILLIAISFYFSLHTAKKISNPILELSNRVRASTNEKDVLCSPIGTNDELEELAHAFDERTLNLQHQAEHDYLTGLPNRILFLDRLNHALKLAKRNQIKLAVLFIDLDRFKEINDSFGHDFGDLLLNYAAESLSSVLRTSDSIARLGGDEFAILIEQFDDETDVVDIAKKILAVFKKSFSLQGHQVYTTCSIGISVYPVHGASSEELLRNADAAMYKAKSEGRNAFQFYTKEMTKRAYERVLLESYLRQAIDEHQFHLNYQPQVNMQNGSLIGLECLIRWRHPQIGMIPPDQFITLAEETGMIIDIDRWVLRSAVAQLSSWLKQGLSPGILSLNLSMIQLNQVDFIEFVERVIHEFGVDPSHLMFEVTETSIMKDPNRAIIMLQKLKEVGFQISVDDF
jgi:diguanylate cyclase (GGDEF)-like protein